MIVNGKQATVPAQGMSLRDYFAGQALADLSANDAPAWAKAEWAYECADAMLAARKEDAT